MPAAILAHSEIFSGVAQRTDARRLTTCRGGDTLALGQKAGLELPAEAGDAFCVFNGGVRGGVACMGACGDCTAISRQDGAHRRAVRGGRQQRCQWPRHRTRADRALEATGNNRPAPRRGHHTRHRYRRQEPARRPHPADQLHAIAAGACDVGEAALRCADRHNADHAHLALAAGHRQPPVVAGEGCRRAYPVRSCAARTDQHGQCGHAAHQPFVQHAGESENRNRELQRRRADDDRRDGRACASCHRRGEFGAGGRACQPRAIAWRFLGLARIS